MEWTNSIVISAAAGVAVAWPPLHKVATLQAMGLLDATTARNTALSPPGVRWMTLPRWAVKIPAAGHKHPSLRQLVE